MRNMDDVRQGDNIRWWEPPEPRRQAGSNGLARISYLSPVQH
jgi:hypothetical protein